MRNWADARRFIGTEVLRLLVAGVLVGLALTGVELGFAWSLQAFLVTAGALAPSAALTFFSLPRPEGAAALAALVLIGSGRAFLVGFQSYLQGASAEIFKTRIRLRLLSQVFRAQSASATDAMTMFSIRAEAAGSGLSALQVLITQSTLTVFLLLTLGSLSFRMTAVAVGALAVLAFPLRFADARVRHNGQSLGIEWQRSTERLLVSIRNLLLLQILGTRGQEEDKTRGHVESYQTNVLSYYRVTGLKIALPQAIGLFVVAATTGLAVRGRWLTPGGIVAFLYLFLRFVQVAATAAQSWTTFAFNRPQLEAVWEWWDAPIDEIAQGAAPAGETARQVGFRVRGARFRYPRASEDALAAVDLDVTPGQALVVTGPSGAGKSTLISLLLGLIAPTAGAVEAVLDGEEFPAYAARGRLLPSVGYVGPESFLIEGDIRDNLRYGLTTKPSEAEFEAALAAAECSFLSALPLGLAHRLTEQGQGLSAGQKQRLALARALLRRPALLILDEATSNLDIETEARVVETLTRLKGRMTIVAVSHRPALLALADQRLSLDAPPRD
jgi:ABC-type multidrug transport system fused ATPase/permease subunit